MRIAGEICHSLGGLDLPGVMLLGYVDDLTTFYAETDVIVAPMLMGSGLKMKVAEALSYGVPVVGTAIGFEGFGAEAAAHRCADVAAVKAAILALRSDPAALAALTEACATMFARFNTISQQAEAELADVIHAASCKQPVAVAATAAFVEPTAQSWPIDVRSVNSALQDDPAFGQLLATERLDEEAARAIRYAPERRRWFAGSTLAPETTLSLGPVAVALSPEWVRGKRLPHVIREAAACAFRDARPDWATTAQCVGASANGFALALVLPSHLLTGVRAVAAFLIEPNGGRAHELTLDGIAPLGLPPGFAFETQRAELTPVPGVVSVSGIGLAPIAPNGTVLFLTDDLIGRIAIAPARGSIQP